MGNLRFHSEGLKEPTTTSLVAIRKGEETRKESEEREVPGGNWPIPANGETAQINGRGRNSSAN